ncbi:hypothetical protein DFH08DRAFT_710363 [Mycena albidolilacea]|uniref:Uncharacterized protein n=1 Tax=Mycena albidolilacea TaxID=1033008 RepID=A0AAD7EI81_9AGAR|nr:hypothetical protein DFH08DRAFT_710363 [Mycena albidolilacea]
MYRIPHYYRDQGAALLEGSVRFRVTSWNAPSSFQHGYDLLSPSGIPWQVTLPHHRLHAAQYMLASVISWWRRIW